MVRKTEHKVPWKKVNFCRRYTDSYGAFTAAILSAVNYCVNFFVHLTAKIWYTTHLTFLVHTKVDQFTSVIQLFSKYLMQQFMPNKCKCKWTFIILLANRTLGSVHTKRTAPRMRHQSIFIYKWTICIFIWDIDCYNNNLVPKRQKNSTEF